MKLLIDMNLSPSWVQALALEGVDALHWATVGQANAPDTTLLAFARDRDLVVLTHDLDFGNLLALSGAHKPSVIQLRSDDLSAASLAASVALVTRHFQHELEQGALVTFDPSKTRVRILPLTR